MAQLTRYDVKVDLYADWVKYMRHELLESGHAIEVDASGLEICKIFFNLRWRRVTPKPRRVLISEEFHCPSEQTEGLEIFREKAEQGDDLNPHLGGRFSSPSFNDMMLNDWGICHFHLGIELGSDGFIERTGPILFARVLSDKIYFIDIRNHGGRVYKHVWTDKEIMEIVHRNWPESLMQYQSGFNDISFDVTQEERAEFRKYGITTVLKMEDGTIYYPPGEGYMSDGTSVNVVTAHDQNARGLRNIEEMLTSNIEVIADDICKITGYKGNTYEFKLEIEGETFVAVEKNSHAHLRLFDVFDLNKN